MRITAPVLVVILLVQAVKAEDVMRIYVWRVLDGYGVQEVRENGYSAWVAARSGDDEGAVILQAADGTARAEVSIRGEGGTFPDAHRIERATLCQKEYILVSTKHDLVGDWVVFLYTRHIFKAGDLSHIVSVEDPDSTSAGGLIRAFLSEPVLAALNCPKG